MWLKKVLRGRKFLDTLAACLAAQGQFDKALELELEAIQKLKNVDYAGQYASRAVLYLQKRSMKK